MVLRRGRWRVESVDLGGRLADMTRWRWPVLFWLPSARRELNLHQLLTDTDVPDLVATAAGDRATATGQSPAENVWWLHGHHGPRLRLAELPYDDDTTAPVNAWPNQPISPNQEWSCHAIRDPLPRAGQHLTRRTMVRRRDDRRLNRRAPRGPTPATALAPPAVPSMSSRSPW